MHIPRFHSIGEPDGHFYALAFVLGTYGTPNTPGWQGETFFVLDFSPSVAFTRFSVSTILPDGHLLAYTRGVDQLDSVEYALLRAWQCERIPLQAWRLFPASSIDETAFNGNAEVWVAYVAARRRVAHIIFHARSFVPFEPGFRFSESCVSELLGGDAPDNEEILKCVLQD